MYSVYFAQLVVFLHILCYHDKWDISIYHFHITRVTFNVTQTHSAVLHNICTTLLLLCHSAVLSDSLDDFIRERGVGPCDNASDV